jgi:hypothetical protein
MAPSGSVLQQHTHCLDRLILNVAPDDAATGLIEVKRHNNERGENLEHGVACEPEAACETEHRVKRIAHL